MLLSTDPKVGMDFTEKPTEASGSPQQQSQKPAETPNRKHRSASVASIAHASQSGPPAEAAEDRQGPSSDTANGRNNAEVHARTYSNASSIAHEQLPLYSPQLRSNTIEPEHSTDSHRSGALSSSSPTKIRQTQSEIPRKTRNNSHRPRGSSVTSCASNKETEQDEEKSESGQGNGNDNTKMYTLWRPWEEGILKDWLSDPENSKLFNAPRSKKECHERIRRVLPHKTSRAIEGKIRTLEKQYHKALLEYQNQESINYPGKRPEDVAATVHSDFYRLEAIFNPARAKARLQQESSNSRHSNHQRAASDNRKASWSGLGGATHAADKANGAVQEGRISATSANAGAGLSNLVSAPRNSPPPPIEATESMPVGSSLTAHGRRIAPKRGIEGTNANDSDQPVKMSSNKRSRTMPSITQNRLSPGHQYPHHYLHHPQRSPLPLQQASIHLQQQQQQQQQQQRMYENGAARMVYDAAGRPSTATLPMMQMSMQSPVATSNGPLAVSNMHQHHMPRSHPTPANMHEAAETPSSGAIQGTREELEWLQFNLRREELEFRKVVFTHDKSLEKKRLQLEEQRIEAQRQEMELEKKRLDVHKQQLDIQIESLKSLTATLVEAVSQISTALGPKSNESAQQK
ncbi:hypothetical protein EV183_002120 [Coemansia sp. RSA 2336]|nr:hypothetical protein EV183_002120 [Coemansia sp. RSA 2336]